MNSPNPQGEIQLACGFFSILPDSGPAETVAGYELVWYRETANLPRLSRAPILSCPSQSCSPDRGLFYSPWPA